MAYWKTSLLVATICTLMAMSAESAKGRVAEKRSQRNGNDQDKVARGTIGALYTLTGQRP